MSETPKIADAELEIMKVLWSESPLTANEIVAALAQSKSWDPRTVKTLINRLHNKGAIGFEKNGRQYLYHPILSQESCIRSETKSFLSKFRDGMMRPLLVAFLEEGKLSKAEINELKEMLEEQSKG